MLGMIGPRSIRMKVLVGLTALALSGVVIGSQYAFDRAAEQRELARFRKLTTTAAQKEIRIMTETEGPIAAWKFTKRVYFEDQSIVYGNADGHAIAHTVGEGMYDRYGLAQALRECDHSFSEGCMHGVVARLIEQTGVGSPAVMGSICAGQKDPNSCAHGAGHGINDATARDLHVSLDWCRQFADAIAPDCVEGALMDNSWDWDRAGVERDPWAICAPLEKEFDVACASAIGNYFSEMRNDSEERLRYEPGYISDVCDKAPTKDMKDRCFLRLAQSIVRRAQADPARMFSLCSELSATRQNACIVSANEFVDGQKVF